jgi:uncharacterized protein with von Willebrand factor type A (vWA) domain
MRRLVAQFVEQLRAADIRISPAEAIDAIRAVAAAGFERDRMREALAAALIKDEADRPAFDRIFTAWLRRTIATEARDPGSHTGVIGAGKKPSADGGGQPEKPPESSSEAPAPQSTRPTENESESPQKSKRQESDDSDDNDADDSGDQADLSGDDAAQSSSGSGESSGIDAAEKSRLKAIERLPFTNYSELEFETARTALTPLIRRFRVRAGRRLRAARRGRVDFRRTIRAAIQRGGAMVDLKMRARRPRRVDLLILADVSGSVRYAATLMLELTAGVRKMFRRTSSFVFIDKLAEADFEDGHLVMTPPLDLYARSDFGRVLAELREQHAQLLGPATIVIILGDGRNNRRPARADTLADIARRCRAVCWLNPEPVDRWGRGDSAIETYARHADLLIAATNLRELEDAILTIGRPRRGGASAIGPALNLAR